MARGRNYDRQARTRQCGFDRLLPLLPCRHRATAYCSRSHWPQRPRQALTCRAKAAGDGTRQVGTNSRLTLVCGAPAPGGHSWLAGQGRQADEPRGANSPSAQARQWVVLLLVPAEQIVQLLLSAVRWPRDRSQSLHSAEPYGAYWAGPHSSQSPACSRCPGAHLMQLLLSSDGALPSLHRVQRPPAFET